MSGSAFWKNCNLQTLRAKHCKRVGAKCEIFNVFAFTPRFSLGERTQVRTTNELSLGCYLLQKTPVGAQRLRPLGFALFVV